MSEVVHLERRNDRGAVRSLGYLAIGTRRLDEWERFAQEVLGLEAYRVGDRLKLRMDERLWRFELIANGREDVLAAGFEVTNEATLRELAVHLEALGYRLRDDYAADASRRNVEAMVVVDDPDGLPIEICCAVESTPERPFISASGVSRFVTAEQGLGHIVLSVSALDRSRRFYEDGLGFRVSDFVDLATRDGSLHLVFLHCNRRQHTLAMAELPTAKRLQHFMIEAESIRDVGLALDRAKKAGYAISRDLGQHTNDEMVSFYVKSPSGFDVEFGCGGRTIDPQWSVRRYSAGSIWGHGRGT